MAFVYRAVMGGWDRMPVGAWYSTQSQNSTATNTEYIMTVNTTSFARDIVVVDGSKFKVSQAGVYNLQFSAQYFNNNGGGGTAAVEIWLKKNGTTLPHTGTRYSITPNHPYVVASLNFFVEAAVDDYFQIAWDTNTADINLINNTAISPGSDIPSVIVTMNQVG
jgi:hypothetical protein